MRQLSTSVKNERGSSASLCSRNKIRASFGFLLFVVLSHLESFRKFTLFSNTFFEPSPSSDTNFPVGSTSHLITSTSHLVPEHSKLQSAARKATKMPLEHPAKRFLAGRQLIFEVVAPGTTRCMIACFLHPYQVVDDESLDELESGASLRRTVLVTLKRGFGVEEAEEAISRLSGTVLSGNVVTLRLCGKPASDDTRGVFPDQRPVLVDTTKHASPRHSQTD